MATAVVEERQLLKALRWRDGFVVALAGISPRPGPLGLDALDILRIEADLIFAGYEFCDQIDPFEAGIGFTVPLKSKEDDFVGRHALHRRQASLPRTQVGLELADNQTAAHGDCVHVGRSQVG